MDDAETPRVGLSIPQQPQDPSEGAPCPEMSWQRFRDLVEHAGFLLCRYDLTPERAFRYISAGAGTVFGYAPNEWLANPALLTSMVDASDLPTFEAVLTGHHSAEPITIAVRHKDGSPRWIEFEFSAVTDEQGVTVATEGILRDVTALRRASDMRRLVSAVSKTLSGSHDEDHILQDVTRHVVPRFADWCMVSLLGEHQLRRVEVASADPAHAAVIERLRHAQLAQGPSELLTTVLRTRTPVLIAQPTADQLLEFTHDADLRDQIQAVGVRSLIVAPLLVHDRLLGAMTFVSLAHGPRYDSGDVSFAEELAALAASAIDIARFSSEAHEAAQLREEFLSVAAHELKTPITNLRGLGQVLMRRLSRGTTIDPERVREVLTALDQQTGKVTRLIEQLLDVSRMRYGSLELNRTVIDLTTIAEGAANSARALGSGHNIHVSSTGPVMVLVDPLRIEQVLTNLLDNAIKYGPRAQSITIDVDKVDATQARIAVTDEGPGIPVEERERIFDRFYQVRSGARKASGMGLGLYISRQIAEMHGGTVVIQDMQQAGTRFVVTLPLQDQDPGK